MSIEFVITNQGNNFGFNNTWIANTDEPIFCSACKSEINSGDWVRFQTKHSQNGINSLKHLTGKQYCELCWGCVKGGARDAIVFKIKDVDKHESERGTKAA